MKLKNGVLLSALDSSTVAVAAGEAGKAFHGMIRMNETAAFLAAALQEETSEDALVAALRSEYDVDEETARRNVNKVLDAFRSVGLLDE